MGVLQMILIHLKGQVVLSRGGKLTTSHLLLLQLLLFKQMTALGCLVRVSHVRMAGTYPTDHACVSRGMVPHVLVAAV